MPEVSVIIPTYNCGQYIVEAIESVRGQTYKDFEIVVVDDGSTDNTREVLKEYIENSLINYIYQKNQGPGAARNTGIRSARGEYVAFLDADDTLTEDSLEKRMGLINSYPDVGFVFSNFYDQGHWSEKGIAFKDKDFVLKFRKTAHFSPVGVIFSSNSFKDICVIPFYVQTATVITKRTLYESVGLFRTDTYACEDRDMWLRLGKHEKKIGYINLPLAYYKRYRSSFNAGSALKYAESRFNFFNSLLEENKEYGTMCRAVRRRMSWVYYDLAYYYYKERMKNQATQNIMKSIYYNPWNRVAYIFLLSSLIDPKIRKLLKRFIIFLRGIGLGYVY
jgi:glycosyltransferase involved in cell wall biosynthesis